MTKLPDIVENALEAIDNLRENGGHLHSITNSVAQNFTANVLLACGSTVSMTANPAEMPDFMAKADALHINLGTLNDARMSAIRIAAEKALVSKLPITLDPVMINVSSIRLGFASELVGGVSIIRGNTEEIACLEGKLNENTCLVETGKIDRIRKADTRISIENGHPLMGQVIATGCALGALIAVLSSKTEDARVACLAALLWFAVSGEIAAENAKGPGGFQPAFIDALNLISLNEIRKRAKVST